MIFSRILLLIIMAFHLLPTASYGQKTLLPLSPALLSKQPSYFADTIHSTNYILQFRGKSIPLLPAEVKLVYSNTEIIIVKCKPAKILGFLSAIPGLIYADENVWPTEESGVLNYDMSLNRINAVWEKFPQYNGAGRAVSVKEARMDTSDIDLPGRNIPSSVAAAAGSTHATVMTTLIAGAGNSFYTGKGVAPTARYSSADFLTVLPDAPSYYTQSGITIQNHSYGTGIQNYYGINARAFDLSQDINPLLQHIFSSGNSGSQISSNGRYSGIAFYANITGNMKMAKNVLLAGAVDSAGKVVPLSSKGPAFDGRIKPEIVAYGEDGSSGSAALVSGTSLLLQQAYSHLYNSDMPSALLRAILINSADDIAEQGPDFESGFGNMNAFAAMQTVTGNRFFTGTLLAGEASDYIIDIPASARKLKVSLSWNDPAAATGVEKALVNDLDLEVFSVGAGQTYLPWILNISPYVDSLRKPAIRSIDTLNNNEQVSIEVPAGQYIIKIKGAGVNVGPQGYAVAYQWDKDSSFQWQFPLRDDPVQSGSKFFTRWKSVFPKGTRGTFEASFDSGLSWLRISDTVLLENQQYELNVPESFTTAKLKITVANDLYESDSFLISPKLETSLNFVCDTNLLAYWHGVNSASSYNVYRLTGNAMKVIYNTKDTIAFLPRPGSTYISVAPVAGNRQGFRGPAINFLQQGIGCYINNFLADLINNNQAVLSLQIGSMYRVKNIQILKLSRQNEEIFFTDQPKIDTYSLTDTKLEPGLNQYQALVTLENGLIVRSSVETVYYLNKSSHLLFPNPVPSGASIFLLSDFPVEGEGVVFDAWGRKMLQFAISEKQQEISIAALRKGIYYMILFREAKLIRRLPFIIL